MKGTFMKGAKLVKDILDWGSNTWHSTPDLTSAHDLAVVEVNVEPGGGHNFHTHPNQEEVIYVINGEIEQWVGQEKQILGPGDSAFIPKGLVHASFNISDRPTKFLAILGPCIGDKGYEIEEVHEQEPWKSIR